MKIEVTQVSPVRRHMTVEADADEVAREREALLRRYAREARIPGFRPGKAPLAVVRARFGREVDEDLKERLVARLYGVAIREKELSPLGDPSLEEVSMEEGKPFRFKTSFEVAPEFTPKDYRGVEARRPSTEVADTEVEKMLEELRQARAQLVSKEEGAAATGDVIVADVEGNPEQGEPFRREAMMIEVGAPANLPEFNDHLEGAATGGNLEFSVRYPAEYDHKHLAGKVVAYRVQVHEVKRRQVPDLDDEFAKDVGEFDNLDDLRARVRADLLERKEAQADEEARRAVLDKVLLQNPIPLPGVLVEEEIRHRLEDMVRMMAARGIDPRTAEVDWKALRSRQEEPARKAVHARLLLDAVAGKEGLSVGDAEVEERIEKEARHTGENPEKLKARLKKEDRLQAFKNQMLRESALDFLMSVANIEREE